jgi:hypothetical protein
MPDVLSVHPTLIEMLRFSIYREATYPTRPELHQRIKVIEKAALFLVDQLSD